MSRLRLVTSQGEVAPGYPVRDVAHPALAAFEREFDFLTRTLRRLGVARDDVEDLAHEVFLVLYQTWDKYDTTRPLRSYLFGIAFRVAANHRRKRSRETRELSFEPVSLTKSPEQVLDEQRSRTLVLGALNRVPLPRRAVLIMHDIEQIPMSQIAETLEIYRFTGYSRLRKARREFAAAVTFLLRGGRIS